MPNTPTATLSYGFIGEGCSMESDVLRAEGEFLVLFGLYQ